MQEFELKFLEVDVPKLEKKLLEVGAEKVGEFDYTRTIFCSSDSNMEKGGGWVRLRTDGKETTLTYKENIKGKNKDGTNIEIVGMKEIEVVVDSYEKTYEFIKAIGIDVNKTEKNKRIRYKKGDVIFDIDSWPFIPTYLEVESSSYEKVKNAARELGFDPEAGIIGTAGTIYKKYGINIDEYSSITFEGMVRK